MGRRVNLSLPSLHALAQRLLPLLDLTSLGEDDTPACIEALCASARTPFGSPAAVCVYPEHVTTARRALDGTAVKVASVVNFPDGGGDAERIARETRRAISAGAHEIDLVLPYRALREGDLASARRAVVACRASCGQHVALKLILETGELASSQLIRSACLLGIEAGVDFLKTSTGKAAIGATPTAAACILEVIAEAGGRCGFKAAGGIRTLEDASVYLGMAETRLGPDWVAPSRFRIGASTLFTLLRDALTVAV